MARNEWLPWMAVCLLASQTAAPADSLPAAIRACATEADDSSRLHCYDRAANQFGSVVDGNCGGSHCPNAPAAGKALSSKTVAPAATHTPAEPNTAQQFGLSSSQILQKESTGDAPPRLRRLTAHVLELRPARSGRLVVRLDNGQVWEQKEDGPDLNMVVGGEVTIDRGVLGAYYLSAGSKHAAIKVTRVE